MEDGNKSRRAFLALLPVAVVGALVGARSGAAHPGRAPRAYEHPEPRDGIDASAVLSPGQLANPSADPVFELVREMPEVMDGVRCHCGCAELDGFYSLLSCYEKQGMAQFCEICQGEARLVHELHGKGKSLKAIRTSIDARYG